MALNRSNLPPHKRTIPGSIAGRLRTAAPFSLLDAAIVYAVYLLALVIRFEGGIPELFWGRFQRFALAAIALHVGMNAAFGLYGRVWRYASIEEARRIVAATFLVGGILVAGSRLVGQPLPISVMGIGFIFTLAGFAAVRFQSRLFGLRRREYTGADGRRVVVVGAGDLGARIVKDMLENPRVHQWPVAIVSADRRPKGMFIHDVPVVAGLSSLRETIKEHRPDQVLVAVPDADSVTYRRLLAVCEEERIPMRILPRIDEVVGGHPTLRDVRDLRIEDLIGREEVETDLHEVRALLQGRRVLVTGAGGSIGAEITRQVAALEPAALFALDNDETHLHDLQTTLHAHHGLVEPVLADIRERDRLMAVCASLRPDVVFHAAAHKHVPLLEEHPGEAIKTNIIGTANLAEAALRSGASHFILISTDKAIDPISVMGASKRLAEQVARSLNGRGCRFSAVRFGNVLGSRGSVVPTFMQQIAAGGPVTVTDPGMTRYFMSVEEAVQLVLQAGAMSDGGEIFMLDMGEPVNILELAERMIRLAGRTPGSDIEIEIIGQRPGERLAEPIRHASEQTVPTDHPKIVRSLPPDLDHAALRTAVHDLIRGSENGGGAALRTRLCALALGTKERIIHLDDEGSAVAIR